MRWQPPSPPSEPTSAAAEVTPIGPKQSGVQCLEGHAKASMTLDIYELRQTLDDVVARCVGILRLCVGVLRGVSVLAVVVPPPPITHAA
jgi:hypothetical protein